MEVICEQQVIPPQKIRAMCTFLENACRKKRIKTNILNNKRNAYLVGEILLAYHHPYQDVSHLFLRCGGSLHLFKKGVPFWSISPFKGLKVCPCKYPTGDRFKYTKKHYFYTQNSGKACLTFRLSVWRHTVPNQPVLMPSASKHDVLYRPIVDTEGIFWGIDA